jgi:hypothetical protein
VLIPHVRSGERAPPGSKSLRIYEPPINVAYILRTSRRRSRPLTMESQLNGNRMDQNVTVQAHDGGFAYHMIAAYQGTQKVQF